MPIRTDVGLVRILITKFQEFDHDHDITQVIDGEFIFDTGDHGDAVEWEVGPKFHGLARVISQEHPDSGYTTVTLRKI